MLVDRYSMLHSLLYSFFPFHFLFIVFINILAGCDHLFCFHFLKNFSANKIFSKTSFIQGHRPISLNLVELQVPPPPPEIFFTSPPPSCPLLRNIFSVSPIRPFPMSLLSCLPSPLPFLRFRLSF